MSINFTSSISSSNSLDDYIEKQNEARKLNKLKEQKKPKAKEKSNDNGVDLNAANDSKVEAKDTFALYAMISIFANLS